MAERYIYIPGKKGNLSVTCKMIHFVWHSGFSISQKQKSIECLFTEAKKNGIDNILEISTKSKEDIGRKLSAFNLTITTKKYNNVFSVESAFQGSKVFANGGPYSDILGKDSVSAKKDIRIKESGKLLGFEFFQDKFPLEPKTYFYDWLYINALNQNQELAMKIIDYQAFSDIEFNHTKSINCQAFSAAMYVTLSNNSLLDKAIKSKLDFLEIASMIYHKNTCSETNATLI